MKKDREYTDAKGRKTYIFETSEIREYLQTRNLYGNRDGEVRTKMALERQKKKGKI